MITHFHCINISSLDVKRMVDFYHQVLGIPLLTDEGDLDGAELGFSKEAPSIVIWDEKRWGESSAKPVTFVFKCDNMEQTYLDLAEKGAQPNPVAIAEWGGKELTLTDPDGNNILILE